MNKENKLIPCQRELFDIPDEVSYLNCAYSSPMLKSVARIGAKHLSKSAQPWRIKTSDFFEPAELARVEFSRLIDADPGDIAVISSVSYGLSVAAQNLRLQAKQKIIVLHDQFPSNVYIWQELAQQRDAIIVTVNRSPTSDLTTAVLAQLTTDVGIVALPQARWTDGALLDLETIGRRCREIGASLVLDLTQTLGVMPFSVQRIKPDFVICAAYKWLLGSYGVTFLYARKDRQNGNPIEHSWINRRNSENFSELTQYQSNFKDGARRYDSGEPSHLTISMAVEGLQQIHRWSIPAIVASIAVKTRMIATEVEQVGMNSLPEAERSPHILGVYIGDCDGERLHRILADNQVFVSLRGQFLRISPHVYNDERDLERLLNTMIKGLETLK